VLAVALVLLVQLQDGIASTMLSLLNPTTALTVLALIILLGLWRLIAMAVAVSRGRSWRRTNTLATFGALALIVVVVHAAGASLAWSAYRAGSDIFVGDTGPDGQQPGESLAPGAAPGGSAAPHPTPETEDSRVTVLLTGIDSSETRNHALTDTLLVVSADPVTGKVAMVSFPRDIARFELTSGKTFRGKINSLMSYADRNPDEFPDGGLATLTRELGHILGTPIHYYAAVDLAGFARMIDRVDGVTINNTTAINDASYGGWTDGRPVGFSLSVGSHTLGGQEALAYVRSRHGSSDFARARRQQQLLIALQRKLTDPTMLPNLPGILMDASDTVRTNFPVDGLSNMVDLAARVDDDAGIERVVLDAPYSNHPPTSSTGGSYILKLDMAKVQELSVSLFGDDSAYYVASAPGASPSGSPAAP